MAATSVINTREMKYTGVGIAALKSGNLHPFTNVNIPNGDISDNALFSNRVWSQRQRDAHPPRFTDELRHNIGNYPLTSELASWVAEALVKYQPTDEVLELVRPFASEFHTHLEKERANSTGFHDLNLVELAYQVSLEVGGALLLAASANGDPVDLQVEFHSSRAARDDHFAPWGKLLTGLECDPPIIAQFPFYLMMCQSFGLENDSSQEDYVYSALTGVDWAKGKNVFSERFVNFEKRAIAAVPRLDDRLSGKDGD
jgi:hypothetical protein